MSVNFGSKRVVTGAHYGLRDWMAQRATALLMGRIALKFDSSYAVFVYARFQFANC